MRPSKHKPIVVSYHLFTRNGTFYYRSNVPVDLQQHFPTTEIKRSFKTKESKLAKGMVNPSNDWHTNSIWGIPKSIQGIKKVNNLVTYLLSDCLQLVTPFLYLALYVLLL